MATSRKLNGIERFLRGEKGQRFFNFAYSIGAAIVIWGALFKILHLPGGSTLLCIGMGTEIAMFILTAFDSPSKEYAWEQVFPELGDGEATGKRRRRRSGDAQMDENGEEAAYVEGVEGDEAAAESEAEGDEAAAEGGYQSENEADYMPPQDEPVQAYPGRYYGGTDHATGRKAPAGVSTEYPGDEAQADGEAGASGRENTTITGPQGGAMVQGQQGAAYPAASGIGIAPEDAESLRESISKMAAAAEQLSQMADLTTATQDYLTRVAGIADQMTQLQETTAQLNEVSTVLLESYRAITDNSSSISESANGYVQSMEDLNRNIGGLNTIYEIQLKSISSQLESIDRVNRGLKDIKDMYEKSARQSSRYCEETERMTRYMTQLNSVYEKMVTAMTINMYNPMMGQNGGSVPPQPPRRDEFDPFDEKRNRDNYDNR